ncbi:MAG: hypothetical protein JKY94_09570 [Rhodobacteraceae bacterium]|nr:hypothetical protein [Paracoccaceae bacterium]
MKITRLVWKLVFVLFLFLSLTLNVAMFVGGSMYKMDGQRDRVLVRGT